METEYRNQVWVRGLSLQNLASSDTDRPSLARGVAECKNEDCPYHEMQDFAERARVTKLDFFSNSKSTWKRRENGINFLKPP